MPALTLTQASSAISGSGAHAVQENSRRDKAPVAPEPGSFSAPLWEWILKWGLLPLSVL